MSEEKYANGKCFILSPDGYEEITYAELCRRRDADESYKDKKFIPLHGMLIVHLDNDCNTAVEIFPELFRSYFS